MKTCCVSSGSAMSLRSELSPQSKPLPKVAFARQMQGGGLLCLGVVVKLVEELGSCGEMSHQVFSLSMVTARSVAIVTPTNIAPMATIVKVVNSEIAPVWVLIRLKRMKSCGKNPVYDQAIGAGATIRLFAAPLTSTEIDPRKWSARPWLQPRQCPPSARNALPLPWDSKTESRLDASRVSYRDISPQVPTHDATSVAIECWLDVTMTSHVVGLWSDESSIGLSRTSLNSG